MALIGSELQKSAAHAKNEEHLQSLLNHLRLRQEIVRQGGGRGRWRSTGRAGK